MAGTHDPSRRGLALVGVIAVWIVLLLGRLVELQVVHRDRYVRKARLQQERTVDLPPRRGAITDRNGVPLAVTAQIDSVFAIPSDIKDSGKAPAVAARLAPLLGLPVAEVARKLGDGDRDFVWVARRIDEPTAQAVRALRLPGIRLIKESTRRYPEGTLAAAVLGYVGTDNQGLAGLEFKHDLVVKGHPAKVTVFRDAAQRSYAVGSRSAGGVEGASLTLTLDASIQHVAERELAAAAEKYHARAGSVVVLEPRTGAVLALASYPGFDPNRYAEADPEHRRCRPLADAYEPGSTFKSITVAAALEAGTVSPGDIIDCGNGVLTIGRTTIHEHGRNRWRALPLSAVLAHSSNIGTAHIALGLGRAPFWKTVRAFGFGQKTGIDLDGESGGLLRDVSTWSALTLPTMSFGQEIGVTALQMARAYAAVASGGVMPTPYLVAEVAKGPNDVRRHRPAEGVRVVSEPTARALTRLLEGVVDDGTGKAAAVSGFTVAGKTGTAQKASPGGGYSRDRFVASFFGFVPSEAPRVVIAVVVDEPKGKIYGGDVAAPVFAGVAAESLKVLGVPSKPPADGIVPTVLVADLERGAGPVSGTPDARLVLTAARSSRPSDTELSRIAEGVGFVPDVTGLPAREAVRTLARAGLAARLTGHGFVTAQEPVAGAPLERGAACSLTLSLEAPPERPGSLEPAS